MRKFGYNKYRESEVNKANLPFCDAASRIPPTTEFFTDDMHYNNAGAQRLAETIFECLKTKHLLPQPLLLHGSSSDGNRH